MTARAETRKTQGLRREQLLPSAGAEKHKARVEIPGPESGGRIIQGAACPDSLLITLSQGLAGPAGAVTSSCCLSLALGHTCSVGQHGDCPLASYHKPCPRSSQAALLSFSRHTSFLTCTPSWLPSFPRVSLSAPSLPPSTSPLFGASFSQLPNS